MKVFFFVILISVSLHSFQNFQYRFVGIVKDIKYVAKGEDGKYIFWIRTDTGREFFFKASEIPYYLGNSKLIYLFLHQLTENLPNILIKNHL